MKTALKALTDSSGAYAFAAVPEGSIEIRASMMALAREARGEDVEGYRGEFISMVERARTLSGGGDTATR